MSMPGPAREPARGAIAAAVCYFLWGLVPLYWKQLGGIDPLELIAHRHVWSLALLVILLAFLGGFAAVRDALSTPGRVATNLLNAALLTGNWLVYVWGVNTGRVVETSLGYFLVPLVSVALGSVVLGESLRRGQWIAIAIASLGVLVMVVQLRQAPWVALIDRKSTRLNSSHT